MASIRYTNVFFTRRESAPPDSFKVPITPVEMDEKGRKIFRIDTQLPDGIELDSGEHVFRVFENLIDEL